MKGYADYMMILSPSESISEQMEKHRADVQGIIGAYERLDSKAHISIKPMPRRKPYLAEPEIMGLKNNLKLLPPVTLTIDGFDFFTHGDEYRTIYAKIRSTLQTTRWFKVLKKSLNIKDYLVPHIPIARNIHVSAHNKLWPQFKNMRWVEPFEIGQLTILHCEAFNNFAHWEVYLEIPFEARHLISEAPPKQSLLKPLSGNYAASQQISLFEK
ncbi:MAG: 2-5 ligase family protein [Mucilaginibacter sp.]|nr:2-5 ligase family protein [Mucilaginibacter sp.]